MEPLSVQRQASGAVTAPQPVAATATAAAAEPLHVEQVGGTNGAKSSDSENDDDAADCEGSGHEQRKEPAAKRDGEPPLSSQVASSGQASNSRRDATGKGKPRVGEELANSSSSNGSRLHEWLAKEIKSKFNQSDKFTPTTASNTTINTALPTISSPPTEPSSKQSITTVTGAVNKCTSIKQVKSSLLNALIEGKKSWLEQKTVIVDIKNGRRTILDGEEDKEEEEEEEATRGSYKESRQTPSPVASTASRRSQQLVDSLNLISSPVACNTIAREEERRKKAPNTAKKITNQNSKTLAAKSQSKLTGAKQREEAAATDKKDFRQQERKQPEEPSKGGEQDSKTKSNPHRESEPEQQQADQSGSGEKGKKSKAEQRQQVPPIALSGAEADSKGKRPPTFGGAPYRLSRLPYFSYYGKTRNVDLVSSADRKKRGPGGGREEEEEEKKRTTAHRKQEAQSRSGEGTNSSGAGSSSSSSQRSLSSPSSPGAESQGRRAPAGTTSSTKIPTLARSSALGKELSEIDLEDSRELELTTGRSKRDGYSNISNLFPNRPMSARESRRQYPSSSSSSRRNLNLRFGSEERLSRPINRRLPHQQSASHSNLVNLNQQQWRSGKSSLTIGGYGESNRTGRQNRFASSGLDRRNSLRAGQSHHNQSSAYSGGAYATRNRSMNSLNASPYSNTSDTPNTPGPQTAGSMMRRQNSNAAYNVSMGGKQRQIYPNAARSASASGYMRAHHRSPSASSLHYGSAGMSPYGPQVDPDCPVHGYSPVGGQTGGVGGPGGAGGGHSKSSQHLASGGAMDADLLYEPPYNSFYDRPAPQVQPAASLYSPTSPPPPLISHRGHHNPAYNSSTRLAGANSAPAYYNASSRFSMYHHSPTSASVGAGTGSGVRGSSLAPTNEQLRRILGYQPHTRPIYLHPQWAYSRPFIHLQGIRSPSPGSPMGVDGDLDDVDGGPGGEIRPRFEPYNQLLDTQAIRAVDFHPSGEVYAVGSNSRALRICAYPADYELRHFGQDHVTTAPRVLFKFLQVHRGSIYCVSFNSTGQLLATGSNDQTVHIVRYNSVTHSPDGDEYRLTMHDGTVRDLCFIDDASNGSSLLLSAGGGDNKIYVTDCDTITPFQSMAGHTQMIMSLHHWAGANFVSASYDRTIRFWDLRTRACTSIISAPPSSAGTGGKWGGPGAPVCSVKVDSSGRLLASGHSDSTCMLYDIRGARIIQAFKPHDDEIRTVSFSPKSYYLLTGGYDGRIVLSDLQGDLTQPLPSVCVAESDDKIVQSKWHPSDFTFVTTSADKTATLWALPTE